MVVVHGVQTLFEFANFDRMSVVKTILQVAIGVHSKDATLMRHLALPILHYLFGISNFINDWLRLILYFICLAE